jgi:hypothetical protein
MAGARMLGHAVLLKKRIFYRVDRGRYMKKNTFLIALVCCAALTLAGCEEADFEVQENNIDNGENIAEVLTADSTGTWDAIGERVAQSFTVNAVHNYTVKGIKVKLAKTGYAVVESDTDAIVARVYAGTGDPGSSGSVLAESYPVFCKRLSETAAYVPFGFKSNLSVAKSTKYWIVLTMTQDGVAPTPGASNYVVYYYNTDTAALANGDLVFYNGSSWEATIGDVGIVVFGYYAAD